MPLSTAARGAAEGMNMKELNDYHSRLALSYTDFI